MLDGSHWPPASGAEEDLAASSSPLASSGLRRRNVLTKAATRGCAVQPRTWETAFFMRAAALGQDGPRTSLPCPHPIHVGPEEHEVEKITLDRLLVGTQPSVQASELVRGQHGWRPLSLVES